MKNEKFKYKGLIFTFAELLALPECGLTYQQLLYRLKKGLSVEAAFSGESLQKRENKRKRGKGKRTFRKAKGADMPKLLESQKRRIERRETDRIKKIMAVPVSPRACRYYQTEEEKKKEFKTLTTKERGL